MFHKRIYKPLFPEKYAGDPTCIIMRSSWETRFASWCDKNPSVIKWSSEETIIPYRCPTDDKVHRYFVDFKIQIKNKEGLLKTYLIEVKPAKQTQPPVYPGRNTQRYITESMTFIKNQAKWKAAIDWAKDRGYEFKIITEYELGLAA
jgi:CRISPR/Cas system CMR-associated protein Cmr5 small subunit